MEKRRDILKNVAIIGTGLSLGLHRKIAELDCGIEIISLKDVKPLEPMVFEYSNPHSMDYTIYSRDESPSKQGSNFTPKKKKRKK